MLTKFKTGILLHLAGIIAAVFAGVSLWLSQSNFPLLLIILTVLAVLLFNLYRLISSTNKKLADFLLNIRYDDFEAHYSAPAGEPSEKELSSAFNLITGKFRHIRQEKEAQFQYLSAIVENVDTGLICFNAQNKTVLMNRALQQLLHKSHFYGMDAVRKYDAALFDALRDIAPGEKKLVKLVVNNQILQLALRKTTLKIGGEKLHLFAIHNIHTELEQQEVESWQKLIRILTHEILNSVTPVVSLSETAHDMILKSDGFDREALEQSIEAVWRRSKGLLHFTETYRQLTKIPTPHFEPADPVQILDRVLVLLSTQIRDAGVLVSRHSPPTPLKALLDPGLMEQVFINILKNALEAIHHIPEPKLTIGATKTSSGAIEISIADNGPGIPGEMLSQIFVPFFTTKAEGSGIGLSLCRQIVHLHKGQIHVHSVEGKGTCFTISL